MLLSQHFALLFAVLVLYTCCGAPFTQTRRLLQIKRERTRQSDNNVLQLCAAESLRKTLLKGSLGRCGDEGGRTGGDGLGVGDGAGVGSAAVGARVGMQVAAGAAHYA